MFVDLTSADGGSAAVSRTEEADPQGSSIVSFDNSDLIKKVLANSIALP